MNRRVWMRIFGVLLGLTAVLAIAAGSPRAYQSNRPRIAFIYPGGSRSVPRRFGGRHGP